MASARKKYINVEKLSSGEIYALLDGIESDNEDDIENLMNDSDTEFVLDENDFDDEKPNQTDDYDNHVLVPEAAIHVVQNPAEENESKPGSSKSTVGKKRLNGENSESDKKKKKKDNSNNENWKWENKKEPPQKKVCTLVAEVLANLDINSTPFDIFTEVIALERFIDIIVCESNRYAHQKGRTFETTNEEIMAFLGINYIMSINKLPSLEDYWSTDRCIGNEKIRNVMTRTRFQLILQNLHFNDNEKDDKTDKTYKIKPIIDHLNNQFSKSLSNSPTQSVDEHMCKFKGRSSMKQYIKNKPIKWGFKYWYRCDSKTGYLYEFELYRGRKESTEINLGASVVLKLCEELKNTYCFVFFDNFFNGPLLIKRLHENGIYGLGTVRSDRKHMPQMKKDKEMKRGDFQCKFSNDIVCIKWFDNKSVMLLGSNFEEVTSTSSVQRRLKGSASKINVDCPNAIKLYNNNMGGVDLMDQLKSAYQLDRRAKLRFYLRLFFDLFDVALVNSYIIYKIIGKNDLTLKEYKLCIADKLIGTFVSRKLSHPLHRPSKRSRVQKPGPSAPLHLPVFLEKRRRCKKCSEEGKENRTFSACSLCEVALCLQKERNCFTDYHL